MRHLPSADTESPEIKRKPPDRRYGGLKAIGATLPRIAEPTLARYGLAASGLIAEWAAIVGPELAARTLPEKLSFPRGGRTEGTLRVRVEGGLGVELQHLEPQILERINGYFGYRAVARLTLVQAPLPRQPAPPKRSTRALDAEEEQAIEDSVRAVREPGLRDALDRLGRSVLERDMWPRRSR